MDVKRLLERVKAGDNDALKIIYETYSPMMRGVCKGITKEDEDTVSDLVQEAFVLAYMGHRTKCIVGCDGESGEVVCVSVS